MIEQYCYSLITMYTKLMTKMIDYICHSTIDSVWSSLQAFFETCCRTTLYDYIFFTSSIISHIRTLNRLLQMFKECMQIQTIATVLPSMLFYIHISYRQNICKLIRQTFSYNLQTVITMISINPWAICVTKYRDVVDIGLQLTMKHQ